MQVEEQLAELGNVLPDLVGKMDRARADVLYELLKDPTATAERLLALRELLPHCNVSALVAGHPKLMLGMTVSAGEARAGGAAGPGNVAQPARQPAVTCWWLPATCCSACICSQ